MVDTWNAAQLNEAANNGSIGGGGSSLPSVTDSDNGKILGVVDGAWAKMPAPSGNINWTTTEQATGFKFLGEDVYLKIFELETSSVSTEFFNLEESFTGNYIFPASNAQFTNGDGEHFAYPFGVYNNNGVLKAKMYESVSLLSGKQYFPVYYTKSVTP